MKDTERKQNAKQFAEYWKDKGSEKSQSQKFWIELLEKVYSVEISTHYIDFETEIKLDNTSFIDGYIETTHVLIEQKSIDKDLNKPIKQSDGTLLTPFQQAKRYANELPYSQRPRWIVTCNFSEFYIYDMEKPHGEPIKLLLKDLPNQFHTLDFLVDTQSDEIRQETEISLKAGELVGKLYDELQKQYINPNAENTLKSLNILCVRLVFCLYAESSGLFNSHNAFGEYMEQFSEKNFRKGLIELFKVLDTKEEDRDPYEETLNAFPYVNGGLFADENIEIPNFSKSCIKILLDDMSKSFDWSTISPTIFGAVFESTLNPETRRSGGMHYTSIENIHKVIDPLFLNDLKAELENIKATKYEKTKFNKLRDFQKKLSSLTFLDPACGSGNFLTETYLSLRRLENEVISIINQDQIITDTGGIVKVSINQFYGIEINDFAVTVAKTALWIAEHQMLQETIAIVNSNIEFLPLRTYANIIEANALCIDWESVVSKTKLNYIMGNPPFVGARIMSQSQKNDLLSIFDGVKNSGNLDYVSCWYKKATDMMKNTSIRSALVSTNSITQGEQVAILWKPLFNDGIHIDFTYKTFQWDSEASLKAHVHCVIVGFSIAPNSKKRKIYSNGTIQEANNINGYLLDAPTVFIESRTKPLCKVTQIIKGNMPNDNGNLILSIEERTKLIQKYPNSEPLIKELLGADEFLNNKKRYCLWLKDIEPTQYRHIKPIMERIENVRTYRIKSTRKATQQKANVPMLFGEIRQPNDDYILIPCHSSESRKYIPIGYISKNIISTNANLMIPNAILYEFGVLTSSVHMAWVRAVCGRLKSDYRYSKDIVYNNFPWCNPTEPQKAKIEKTAQAILDARALYPTSSFADLYDELTMPPELRKAHQLNDKAIIEAYDFNKNITESEIVSELMKMYQKLTLEKG